MVGGSRIKQRLLPLCAFLTAFTVVMTILVYSTDIKGRRYQRIQLNLSVSADFQNAGQDDPQLIEYIQEHHLKLPRSVNSNDLSTLIPQPEFVDVFKWKKYGIFVETGAYRHGDESRTYWLEKTLGWRGLLTQPDPYDYSILKKHARTRSNSYMANVCLSPTSNPKQVSFRSSAGNGSQVPTFLTQVQCFPLYSLLLAYNATNIDYLSLNAEKAEFQVLKTLPFHKVNIRVIGIVTSTESKEDGSEILRVIKLLSAHGYRLNQKLSTENQYLFVCSKGFNGCSAPRISI